MNEPIKAGDLCEVVGGLGRSKSPNIGLRVTVKHRVYGNLGMDHTQYGRVVRCEGKGIMQLSEAGTYIETGWADFPVAWLRKINPPPEPPKAVTRDTPVLDRVT